MARRGTLYVISGPSGVGKSTLVDLLRAWQPSLAYSVSATTRAPRPGEVDGREYFFLSPEAFDRWLAAGDLLEWAEVHGYRYGTLRSQVEQAVARGADLLLEVDVQGARNLEARWDGDLVTIFVMPPSLEALEQRLARRASESPEKRVLRLANARAEMAARGAFDHIVVNDRAEAAAGEIEAIIRRHRGPSTENA